MEGSYSLDKAFQQSYDTVRLPQQGVSRMLSYSAVSQACSKYTYTQADLQSIPKHLRSLNLLPSTLIETNPCSSNHGSLQSNRQTSVILDPSSGCNNPGSSSIYNLFHLRIWQLQSESHSLN